MKIGIIICTYKRKDGKTLEYLTNTLSKDYILLMSENNSTEWVFGTAYRKRGVKLPFTIPGLNSNKLSNDLTFRLDLSTRDMFNSNSRLDQSNAYGTGGQREITIQPSIDYVLNTKINLKFFFDRRRATPYISSSPPITNTRAGVNIRIAL